MRHTLALAVSTLAVLVLFACSAEEDTGPDARNCITQNGVPCPDAGVDLDARSCLTHQGEACPDAGADAGE